MQALAARLYPTGGSAAASQRAGLDQGVLQASWCGSSEQMATPLFCATTALPQAPRQRMCSMSRCAHFLTAAALIAGACCTQICSVLSQAGVALHRPPYWQAAASQDSMLVQYNSLAA